MIHSVTQYFFPLYLFGIFLCVIWQFKLLRGFNKWIWIGFILFFLYYEMTLLPYFNLKYVQYVNGIYAFAVMAKFLFIFLGISQITNKSQRNVLHKLPVLVAILFVVFGSKWDTKILFAFDFLVNMIIVSFLWRKRFSFRPPFRDFLVYFLLYSVCNIVEIVNGLSFYTDCLKILSFIFLGKVGNYFLVKMLVAEKLIKNHG